MTEQTQSEKDSLLEPYRRAGKMSALAGTKPVEAIQELINDDPEKQNAFLEGAEEGQRIRQDQKNPTSK